MKRIEITAICVCILATLSTVGCLCNPGYYGSMPGYCSGMPQIGYDCGSYGYGGAVFSDPCAPCGPSPCAPEMACGGGCAPCGVVEFGSNPCAPCPPIVNCRTSLSNIGNGVLLVGRGVLDVTAAPFVVVGKLLSSGCQYEVIAHCPEVSYCGPVYQTVDPCYSVGTSGCDSCDHGGNGYIEEVPQNGYIQSRATMSQPMMHSRSNTVIQATYKEPVNPGIRFVQPR